MLTTYTLALFLHVCGALGLTIGFCTGFFNLLALRRAGDGAQVLIIGSVMALIDPLQIAGGLLALLTGFFLTAQGWTFTTGWIDVSFASYVLLAALNGAIVQRQRRTLISLARQTPTGPLSAEIVQRLHQPLLGIGLVTQLSLLVAVVFLMTTKPSLLIALVAVALALVAGSGGGLLWRKTAAPIAVSMGR